MLRPIKGPNPVNPKKRANGPMWGSRKRAAVQMIQKKHYVPLNTYSKMLSYKMLSDIKKHQEKKKY